MNTVVQLCQGNTGDVPLILMHGGDGSISAFEPLRRKFKSALWAIQVTPETPKSSLDAQARYYYDAIKTARPHGPYRFAVFSGSALLMAILLHLFSPPDFITQLFFIDNFPTTIFAPTLGLGNMPLHHPDAREFFALAIANLMVDITRRDAGGQDPRRHALADDFLRALDGTRCSTMAKQMVDNVMNHARSGYDFITKTLQCLGQEDFEKWVKGIDVRGPVTVYISSHGIFASIPEDAREMWADLGATRCFPDARIVRLEAGHFDMLGNDVVTEGLESGGISVSRL